MEAKNPDITEQDMHFMELAAKIAEENIDRGGGPFGAVVVRNGEVVATGANSVTLTNDPTAHAEVNAIREACRKEGSFSLAGCRVYSSCEPCPMCLAAIIWANISRVVYGCTREDAAAIGFRDEYIYDFLAGRGAAPLEMLELDREACQQVFVAYQQRAGQLY